MTLTERVARRRDFLDWEFGIFFHFGIRTFYEGHRDWDGRDMPAAGFNPTALDCGQWTRAARDAGARYAILVCKHHDGFANWPTAYSDYSVANSPWKGGAGDVVREFTEACRRDGLKIGLYYSPAERGFTERSGREYDDYFIGQITELLSGYGVIDYLWFDGNGSGGHRYDRERILAAIREMQPEILIFDLWDPDVRWVGNEDGLAPSPHYNTVDFEGSRIFLPAECDCRMRAATWFYSDRDEDTVKSVDELMGIYYYSVGRGANMLLNIGPDRRGLLPDADANRLREFGAELRRRFGTPLARADGAGASCVLPEPALISHVVLTEPLDAPVPVDRFTITVRPRPSAPPLPVYEGRAIGHKAICRFPPVRAAVVEVTAPNLASIAVYP